MAIQGHPRSRVNIRILTKCGKLMADEERLNLENFRRIGSSGSARWYKEALRTFLFCPVYVLITYRLQTCTRLSRNT